MTTWPILSVVTFLPVVGALLIYISRGDDEAAGAIRAGSRCGPR
jgi:NADH-quinone oxidoreductase subunit M